MFALFQHLYHIYILKQPFLFLAKNGRYSYKCKCFSHTITVQTDELFAAEFLSKQRLREDRHTSRLLRYLLQLEPFHYFPAHDGLNPGEPFGYTKYSLYFKNSKD